MSDDFSFPVANRNGTAEAGSVHKLVCLFEIARFEGSLRFACLLMLCDFKLDNMQNPLLTNATVKGPDGQTKQVSFPPSFQAVEPVQPGKRPSKVPYEKGYSQMDWMRLSRNSRSLTGCSGPPRKEITMEEVAAHNTVEDGWTVVRGKVYNLSPYLRYHPGGAKILKLALGKDCTNLFNKYHAWVNVDMLLEKCLVGFLEK